MKRFLLGLLLAISLPVFAAVLWPNGPWLETFQNGFLFGNSSVLSALDNVLIFDNERVDNGNKDIYFQEDFEGAAVAYTCSASLSSSDNILTPINKTKSKVITQSAGALSQSCNSSAITLNIKQKGVLSAACLTGKGANFDFVVYDTTNANELSRMSLEEELTTYCQEFLTQSDTNQIEYRLEARIEVVSSTVEFDDVQFFTNPLSATEIYASSDWADYTPTFSNFTSATVTHAKWRRDGSFMEIHFRGGTGTPQAGIGGVSLPSGYAVASYGGANNQIVGYYGVSFATSLYNRTVLTKQGSSEVTFTCGDGVSGVSNEPRNANTCFSPSSSFSFFARVPIAGWSDKANGVVVKNVESLDISNTNAFSAHVSSTGLVGAEGLDWIKGNASISSTSRYAIEFNDGVFSSAPNCTATPIGITANESWIRIPSTALGLTVQTTNSVGTEQASAFTLKCEKGDDYIRESEKLYTVPVSSLKKVNVKAVGGSGSLGSGTDTIFNEVLDTADGWNGTQYTIQENGSKIKISGSIKYASAVANITGLYVNGSLYRYIGSYSSSYDIYPFNYNSTVGEFSKGDTLSIRGSAAGSVSNVDTSHYLNITEEFGDRGIYLGAFGQPKTYYFERKASGVSSTASFVAGAKTTLPLNISEGDSVGSLATNQITLEKGVYDFDVTIPITFNGGANVLLELQASLLNATDSQVAATSSGMYVRGSGNDIHAFNLNIKKRVYIGDTKSFEIQVIPNVSSGLTVGRVASNGDENTYTQVVVTKVR
jgi:hypothetical protein